MPIQLTCSCGQKYSLPETMAGKKAKCRACAAVLTVPAAVAPPATVAVTPHIAEDDEYRLSEPLPKTPAVVAAPLGAALAAPASSQPSPPLQTAAKGSLPYFVVGYDRIFQSPKLFRVYLDANELLFVYAGAFHSSMIEQFQAQYSQAVQRGAVAGLSAGAGGAAIGAGAVAAGLAIDWVAGKFIQRGVAERAKALDAMTSDELRREVDENKQSFRASATNVDSAVVEPPSTGFWSMDTNPVPAYLRLKHRPTGMWHFMLITEGDVQLAVRGLRMAVPSNSLKILMPGSA